MIFLKDIIEEVFNRREVAPDAYHSSSLIKYMKDTYNMEYVGFSSKGGYSKQNQEYVFRRDGKEFRYTLEDLRNFGAPIEFGGMYSRKSDRWRPKYKRYE